MLIVANRVNMVVMAYRKTAIYKNVTFGLRGSYYRIVGIRATKETIKAATF
jgi:hypothetical protein